LTDGVNNVTGTATDNAGNTADATAAVVNIDTVDPTISYTLNPVAPEGNDGWYTTDAGVIVHFTCEDVGGSGIATCPGDTTLHDGANRSVTGTVTDKAGNTTTVTTTGINIDSVDPTISSTLDPAAPNAAGWYAADVVVDFTCRDAGSGIATCAGDVTLVEGAGQSVTGAATDRAGNTATASVSGIDIDTTAPTVALLGGPTGSYQYGSNPAAPSCYATDALSGIASCVVTGGGTTVGDHSYLATATDTAGNTSTSRSAYTVLAWTLKGFYAPVDMGANVWNTVKGGSSVPLKFEIFSGAELTSVSAVKSFTATAVTCPGSSAVTDAIELTTTGGTSLRYDSTSGQFIQNWQTPKKPGTCAVVTMTAQDGSTISANFMLK
ncbi:PxKF domain-containing protein, partial [Cryobacterium sp. TMT2-15-1]|uniref:PxKF domain-containing protein n=1 Tax=Cryobacterium sp. TMT2-15-1 TaxID=1259246 RepID=UPI00188142CF